MTRILITGAAGMIGQSLIEKLSGSSHEVLATDIHTQKSTSKNVTWVKMSVTDQSSVLDVCGEFEPEVIIHLASIVNPDHGSSREFAYDVDVNGTKHIVAAALKHGTKRIVVTSSGAAYGYHPENIKPLTEDRPLLGNQEFAYSHHKKLVEDDLAELRENHPELEQVILRVGTVIGEHTENQITALFKKKRLLSVRNNTGGFVFIWVNDLVNIILRGIEDGPAGIFNVAGDDQMRSEDIARAMGKSVLSLPAWFLKAALMIAYPLKLSRYQASQVRFMQYRPVLDNTKLKDVFGYVPEKTSAEAFEVWNSANG